MILNVDPSSKKFFFSHCFACKTNKAWPQLAGKLGCDPIDTSVGEKSDVEIYNDEAIPLFTDADRKKLLGGQNEDAALPVGFSWPENTMWRNIDGKIIEAAGGILYIDKFMYENEWIREERLFLPIVENGIIHGGVRANIEPKKGGNYFNLPGTESTKHFLFTDLAERMLEEINDGTKIVMISEGPRDAANTTQLGVPSLANLGAMNSWTPHKINTLLQLDPDLVILAMDGDEAGRLAAETMVQDLHDLFPIHDVIFPVDKHGKKQFDASDITEILLSRILGEACRANDLPFPILYDWNADKSQTRRSEG